MASHLLAMEQVRAAKVLVSLARIFQAYLYRDVRIFVLDPKYSFEVQKAFLDRIMS